MVSKQEWRKERAGPTEFVNAAGEIEIFPNFFEEADLHPAGPPPKTLRELFTERKAKKASYAQPSKSALVLKDDDE